MSGDDASRPRAWARQVTPTFRRRGGEVETAVAHGLRLGSRGRTCSTSREAPAGPSLCRGDEIARVVPHRVPRAAGWTARSASTHDAGGRPRRCRRRGDDVEDGTAWLAPKPRHRANSAASHHDAYAASGTMQAVRTMTTWSRGERWLQPRGRPWRRGWRGNGLADPGLGFGKKAAQNRARTAHSDRLGERFGPLRGQTQRTSRPSTTATERRRVWAVDGLALEAARRGEIVRVQESAKQSGAHAQAAVKAAGESRAPRPW